jgi:predicted membrane protein
MLASVTEGPPARQAGARAGLRASLTATGLAAATALCGALLWGLAAVALDRQFLLAALLIGGGAGSCVARWRPGHWPTIAAGTALTLCGCALGTLLAVVFVLLGRHSLAAVLANLHAVARIYPSAVGWLGLAFWVAAAGLAAGIPLLRQRRIARTATAGEP